MGSLNSKRKRSATVAGGARASDASSLGSSAAASSLDHKKPLAGSPPVRVATGGAADSVAGSPSSKAAKKAADKEAASASKSSKSSKKGAAASSPKGQDPNAFSRKKLEDLYAKYAEPDHPERIGPDGVCAILEELNVKPEEPVVLVMCWHLGAAEACYFSRDEFINGLEKMRVDSIEKLSQQFPLFREELLDADKFRQIYEYAFVFSRERGTRCLGIEMASALMRLLLLPTYPLVEEFLEYIEVQKTCKALNHDQWISMLDLCKTSTDDLSNYDFAGSWPVIYDEFVLWLKQKNPDKYGHVNTESAEDPYASTYSHYRYDDSE